MGSLLAADVDITGTIDSSDSWRLLSACFSWRRCLTVVWTRCVLFKTGHIAIHDFGELVTAQPVHGALRRLRPTGEHVGEHVTIQLQIELLREKVSPILVLGLSLGSKKQNWIGRFRSRSDRLLRHKPKIVLRWIDGVAMIHGAAVSR